MDHCADSLKMEDGEREIINKFMDKFLSKLKPVDESCSTLISYIELFHEATEILVQQLESFCANEGYSKEVGRQFQETTRMAKEHLLKLEGTVMHAKGKTLESFEEFIKFIDKIGKENMKSDRISSCCFHLQTNCSSTSYNIKEERIKLIVKENEELRKELDRMKKYVKLKDEIEETFNQERKTHKEEKDKLVNEIDEGLSENLSNQKKLCDAEKELKQMKSYLEASKTEIKNLKKEVKDSENIIEQINDRKKEQEQLFQSNQADLDSCKKDIVSLKSKNDTLKSEYEKLQNDLKNCKQDNKEKDVRIDNLESGIKTEREKVEALGKEKQMSDCELSVLNKRVEELKIDKKHQEELIDTAKEKINNLEESNQKIQKEMESLHQKHQELETSSLNQIKKIEDENDGLIKKCTTLTTVNDSLENEIRRSNSSIIDLKKQAEIHNKTIHQQEQKLQNMEEEEKKLKDTEKSLRENLAKLQDKLAKSEEKSVFNDKELIKTKGELKKKGEEIDDLIRDFSYNKEKLEESVAATQNELDLAQSKISDLSDELEKQKKNNNALKMKIKEKDNSSVDQQKSFEEKIKEIKGQNERLTSNYDELYRKSKENERKSENAICSLRQELNRARIEYENYIKEKERKIKTLERINKEKLEELKNISEVLLAVEEELADIKCMKKMQVQLYSPNRTHLADCVEEGLTSLLQERLETDKRKLEFIQCAKSSDIQPDIPVLLLCITVSRLGTDVANCVHGLTLNSKIALLVFHHKDVHALPNQASDRVLTGPEMKALGGICDMAFLTGKGIYSCDMNKNNVISLINFLNREGVEKSILSK